jgi:hypothetical protein
MSRGMPSMIALLGMLAVAGYQNKDKMLGGLKQTLHRGSMISFSVVLAAALVCICSHAHARFYCAVPGAEHSVAGIAPAPSAALGYPNRAIPPDFPVIDMVGLKIGKAIRRALTPPSSPSLPPSQATVPPPPPPPPQATLPSPQESREQWRKRLFDEMFSYCRQWPNDSACGPNALSGR